MDPAPSPFRASGPHSRSMLSGRYERPRCQSSATSRQMLVSCMAMPRCAAFCSARVSRQPEHVTHHQADDAGHAMAIEEQIVQALIACAIAVHAHAREATAPGIRAASADAARAPGRRVAGCLAALLRGRRSRARDVTRQARRVVRPLRLDRCCRRPRGNRCRARQRRGAAASANSLPAKAKLLECWAKVCAQIAAAFSRHFRQPGSGERRRVHAATSMPSCWAIRLTVALAELITPGKPAPGWVPAPTMNRPGIFGSRLWGRK